jgi:glycosyltransferase involved in cell wall biosynthesis
MKPVIVHVVQHLKPGGIECFALEFQRAAQSVFDVHIISLENKQVKNYWTNLHEFKNFIHMLDKKPGWQANIFVQLKAIFEKIKPLYVHTHHIGPLIYGGVAAKLAGINHIIHTEHDAWHLDNAKQRLLQKLALTLIKPIYVADARFVAEQLKILMPLSSPVVIANGVDTNKFKPSNKHKKTLLKKASLPENLKYIGCSARLETVKAHHILIKALKKLPQDVGLLLAGTGSLKYKLEKLVRELKLENRVFFLGHIEDMTKFYPLLDVFCLSSNNEGLPLSPMEAQACGVPAVLTDVGGCKEAVCNQTGRIVEPNNIDMLSAALIETLNQQVNHSPRDFIKKHRSINKMINQYVSLTQSDFRCKLC